MTDTEAPPDAPTDEPFDEERAKAKIAKANSEAAGLRKRLKELEEKSARLDQIEEAGKTETEKLNAQVAQLTQELSQAQTERLRLEVATSKGLTAAQAKRLVGATQEELEADADELLSTFKPAETPTPPAPGKPTEALGGGGDPTQEPEPDIRKIVADIPRGF